MVYELLIAESFFSQMLRTAHSFVEQVTSACASYS